MHDTGSFNIFQIAVVFSFKEKWKTLVICCVYSNTGCQNLSGVQNLSREQKSHKHLAWCLVNESQ